MHDDADETITRIAAALRPLPDVNPEHKARVLVAVAAERERDRQRRVAASRRWRMAGVGIGAVLAAGGVFALLRVSGAKHDARAVAAAVTEQPHGAANPDAAGAAASPASASEASTSAAFAARDADAVAPQPVELVFRAPSAHRVSVVGDFNGWDAQRNVMTRDASSGLWSQTVVVRPGRHVYAFIVDDSVWMRDPRTPAASDADFGRPGSVLLVGKP